MNISYFYFSVVFVFSMLNSIQLLSSLFLEENLQWKDQSESIVKLCFHLLLQKLKKQNTNNVVLLIHRRKNSGISNMLLIFQFTLYVNYWDEFIYSRTDIFSLRINISLMLRQYIHFCTHYIKLFNRRVFRLILVLPLPKFDAVVESIRIYSY